MSDSSSSTSWIDAVTKLYTAKEQGKLTRARIKANAVSTPVQSPAVQAQVASTPGGVIPNPFLQQIRNKTPGFATSGLVIAVALVIGAIVLLPKFKG